MKMEKITLKIFVMTSIIFLSFAVLIYLPLYFFLPTLYEQYKTNQLQTGLEDIIDKSKDLTVQNAMPLLDEYAQKNNAIIYLQNEEGIIVNPPSYLMQGPVIMGEASPMENQSKNYNAFNAFDVTMPIQFLDNNLMVVVFSTFQQIDEASHVLLRFLPYISSLVLVLGVGSAYLYSRLITKPLIYINGEAQKMAKLDFSGKIEIHSNDELEELSDSLNAMSTNLQQTMFDLQKANEQLKDDIERERKIERKRRDFFATVAHDLKTPLTIMKGYIEGMIYKIGPYQNRDFYLEENRKIIERIEQMVREILNMSKLERNTLTLQLEVVNLSDLIDTITIDFAFFASQKDIKIIKKNLPELYVRTDCALFEKAFKNIIHNAIMYSPHGEKIYIELTEHPKQIQIQIINTGVEIEEDEIQQLFKPFYRIEKSRNRNTGGNGLGLYIVKQIFESLSITYSLNNSLNGVCFLVTITK